MTRPAPDPSVPAMSKWALRAGQFFLIATLMVSMGGHLALLQTIAWGNMLVDFSSQDSFARAVEKTFDGEHPCAMCKVVKKSKSEEEKRPVLKAGMKMEVALPAPVSVPFPRFTETAFRVTEYAGTHAEVYLAVPMQPPRAA
ncbi:MAG: hypothetical protein V4689_18655 [Verrucomicrobiota bacterium]